MNVNFQNNIIINCNEYVGLNTYYCNYNDFRDERYQNLKHLELILNTCQNISGYTNIASVLYALKMISVGLTKSEQSDNTFVSIIKFLQSNKEQLTLFFNKWWNVSQDFFYDMLDLSDAKETIGLRNVSFLKGNDTHSFIVKIATIEVYSEMNQNYYLLQFPNHIFYQDNDEKQLFITTNKFDELCNDLNNLLGI